MTVRVAQKVGFEQISKYANNFGIYENPKYVLAITFDEPDPNNYYGGTISAPLVKSFVSYLKRTNYL